MDLFLKKQACLKLIKKWLKQECKILDKKKMDYYKMGPLDTDYWITKIYGLMINKHNEKKIKRLIKLHREGYPEVFSLDGNLYAYHRLANGFKWIFLTESMNNCRTDSDYDIGVGRRITELLSETYDIINKKNDSNDSNDSNSSHEEEIEIENKNDYLLDDGNDVDEEDV